MTIATPQSISRARPDALRPSHRVSRRVRPPARPGGAAPALRAACVAVLCLWAAPPVTAEPAPTQREKTDRFPGWTGPKPSVPCECRHRGGVATLGDVICLRRGGQSVLARCEMAANNPFWRVLDEACDALNS